MEILSKLQVSTMKMEFCWEHFLPKKELGMNLILDYFEGLLKSPVEVQIVSEHPHVYESAAVNSGHYNFVTDDKTVNARFSFVYHKDDNGWKIVSHHSSVIPA